MDKETQERLRKQIKSYELIADKFMRLYMAMSEYGVAGATLNHNRAIECRVKIAELERIAEQII